MLCSIGTESCYESYMIVVMNWNVCDYHSCEYEIIWRESDIAMISLKSLRSLRTNLKSTVGMWNSKSFAKSAGEIWGTMDISLLSTMVELETCEVFEVSNLKKPRFYLWILNFLLAF